MTEMRFPVHLLNEPSVSKEYRFVNRTEATVYRIKDIDDDGKMGTLEKIDKYQM